MIMKSGIFLLLACLVAGVACVNCMGCRLIDADTDDIEDIVDRIDEGINFLEQISKISTVSRLDDYLKKIPEAHKYSGCSRKHLPAITELRDFLNADTGNVCSQRKISMAEEIHRRYILDRSLDRPHLPRILREFFYHYMYMMSDICAQEALNDLIDLKELSIPKGDLDDAISSLSVGSSLLKYEDIYLFWNLIDRKLIRHNPEVSKYINFDGLYRVSLGVKNAHKIEELQETCRTRVKPIYSRALLSTVRLIDMGYHARASLFRMLLNSNKDVRRLYELTKVCEALLPVRVVEMATLEGTRMVLLREDEVDHVSTNSPQQLEEAEVDHGDRCSVVGLDRLETANRYVAVEIVNDIGNSVNGRTGATSRILKKLLKKMKPSVFKLLSGKRKHERSHEKKFLDSEMELLYASWKSSELHRVEKYLGTESPEDRAAANREKLMYFLGFVWWFFRSLS